MLTPQQRYSREFDQKLSELWLNPHDLNIESSQYLDYFLRNKSFFKYTFNEALIFNVLENFKEKIVGTNTMAIDRGGQVMYVVYTIVQLDKDNHFVANWNWTEEQGILVIVNYFGINREKWFKYLVDEFAKFKTEEKANFSGFNYINK